MEKIVCVGRGPAGGLIFCKIEIEGGELSICGVEGPQPSGGCRGGAGQIKLRGITDYQPGWSAELVAEFQAVWDAWHLNHMRAGCEHQRAKKWSKIPIDKSKPLDSYGKHFPGQRASSYNMAAWVRRDEHPMGLLAFPCPKCGYRYGTKWLKEALPPEVVTFLEGLPETSLQPAWV